MSAIGQAAHQVEIKSRRIVRLDVAVVSKGFRSLQLLLSYGADLEIRNQQGKTPPWDCRTLALLLSYNVDSNADPLAGDSSLQSAMPGGSRDAMKLLLVCGADPNMANFSGYTPLMLAVQFGSEFVKLVLRFGADATAQDTGGIGVQDFARGANVNLLREHSPQSPACVDWISPSVIRIMREFRLSPRPNGWVAACSGAGPQVRWRWRRKRVRLHGKRRFQQLIVHEFGYMFALSVKL